jgi:hypothetical protein
MITQFKDFKPEIPPNCIENSVHTSQMIANQYHKDHFVNNLEGKNHCLFWESYGSLQYTMRKMPSRLLLKNVKIRINKTIILSVVLYGCETWSLTLREEYRVRVFENRVLRRLFGPKRDEVMGE